MKHTRGHFVVLEGMEGAGKSTVLQSMKRYLSTFVPEIICTREPGGTEVGEELRRILKETSLTEPLDPRVELLLMYASRVQLIEQVIKPALQRGAWVLADRFELSTWAYQGGGRKLDQGMITHLSQFCLSGLTADITFFLDIPPELGLTRVQQGRGSFDRIEKESLVFFNAVYEAYQQKLSSVPHLIMIDATQDILEVEKTVLGHLARFLETIGCIDEA